jgi:hypothetical protein
MVAHVLSQVSKVWVYMLEAVVAILKMLEPRPLFTTEVLVAVYSTLDRLVETTSEMKVDVTRRATAKGKGRRIFANH